MAFARDNGVLLRPLGNTVYVLPPYCITAEDLARVGDVVEAGLAAMRAERAGIGADYLRHQCLTCCRWR
jgi:adenosylmethionine-8-amino-7-oxononanoate aminotransferase